MTHHIPSRLARCVAVALICAGASVGQTTASVETIGTGFGQYGPEMVSTRPVLGDTMVTLAWYCQPNAVATFAVSAPPAMATHLGSGLYIQVDMTEFSLFGPVYTDTNGNMQFHTPLNFPPSVAGLSLMAQLHIASPSTLPLGFEVTNGLLFTFGDQ